MWWEFIAKMKLQYQITVPMFGTDFWTSIYHSLSKTA